MAVKKKTKAERIAGPDPEMTPVKLKYLLKYVIPDEEFYRSRAVCGSNTLAWWERGIEDGRSVSEIKRNAEKQRRLTQKAQQSLQLAEKENSRYIEIIRDEYLRTEKQMAQRERLIEDKQQELAALKRLAALKHEMRLLEIEEDLQKELADKRELEMSAKEVESLVVGTSQIEAQTEKYSTVEETAEKRAVRRKKTDKYNPDKSQELALRRSDLHIKTQVMLTDGDFLMTGRVLPAPEPQNILEIMGVTVRSRSNGKKLLSSLSFKLLRGAKYTIFSDRDSLDVFYALLFRNLGEDIVMTEGEVRLDGAVTTDVLKRDYQTRFGRVVSDYSTTLKQFSPSEQTVRRAIERCGVVESITFEYLLQLDASVAGTKMYRKKLSAISETQRELLAFAVTLARGAAFVVTDVDAFKDKVALDTVLQYASVKTFEGTAAFFGTDRSTLSKINNAEYIGF